MECVAVLAVACGCHCDVLRMFEAANGLNGELAWNGYRPECGGYLGGYRCAEGVVFSELAQDGYKVVDCDRLPGRLGGCLGSRDGGRAQRSFYSEVVDVPCDVMDDMPGPYAADIVVDGGTCQDGQNECDDDVRAGWGTR